MYMVVSMEGILLVLYPALFDSYCSVPYIPIFKVIYEPKPVDDPEWLTT